MYQNRLNTIVNIIELQNSRLNNNIIETKPTILLEHKEILPELEEAYEYEEYEKVKQKSKDDLVTLMGLGLVFIFSLSFLIFLYQIALSSYLKSLINLQQCNKFLLYYTLLLLLHHAHEIINFLKNYRHYNI